jgi:hypothetical protein
MSTGDDTLEIDYGREMAIDHLSSTEDSKVIQICAILEIII